MLPPQRLVKDVQLHDPVRVVLGEDRNAVHDGAPLGVVLVQLPLRLAFSPGQDAPALLVDLPADALPVRVVPGGGQHDHRLLPPGGVRSHRKHVPQPPVGLGVQLVDEDGGKGIAVLAVRVGGVDLQHAAVFSVDFPPAVPGPGDGVPLRLSQAGVFHHILGALVDDVGVVLVGGEHPHLGPLLPVEEEVVQAQSGRKFALPVFLGDLVVEESAVAHPGPVLVPDLDAVKLPDGLLLPGQQYKGFSRPLVLSEAQQGEEVQHVLHRLRAVPQHGAVLRPHHAQEGGEPNGIRHAASAPASPASGVQTRSPPASGCPPAIPGGTGW